MRYTLSPRVDRSERAAKGSVGSLCVGLRSGRGLGDLCVNRKAGVAARPEFYGLLNLPGRWSQNAN